MTARAVVGLALGLLAAGGAGSAWAQPADVEQPEALIKAAKAEGKLMLYSSSDESQSRTLLAAFEKKYGIKGSFIRFPTGPLMQRFSTEYDAGKVQADIVSVSSPIPYEARPERFAAVNRQVLPNLAKWPADALKPNYFTWTTEIVALAYNTELLRPDQVPKKWIELADPKWKGKFLMTDPQVADNYLGWLDMVERELGVGFLRKLATQDYKITQSGASGAQMVAAGASSATMCVPVSPRNIAIVAGSPNPNAARLYMNWLLSEEAMRLTCQISPTSIVADPEGKRGCVPVRDGKPMRFDVSEERRRMMAKELGVAR
ncbi:MAG: hypothetical protein ABT05_02090 [Lautropia sp. SCN 66-9]|nr:MAG: hypothetical protein ABT05_02090 [Lautropia sp. SCN 66-9]